MRLAFGFAIVGLSLGLEACQRTPEENLAAKSNNTAVPSLLGASSVALDDYLRSPQNQRVAASFPSAVAPSLEAPFKTQPQQRFEQWSLSALVKTARQEWWWVQQTVLRVAVNVAHDENTQPLSAWSYRDVMVQQYTLYNFNNGVTEKDFSVQRRALSLAEVTADRVTINGVKIQLASPRCNSSIALERAVEAVVASWLLKECPKRFATDGFVFSNASMVSVSAHIPSASVGERLTGMGWVAQAYGQLPALGGAVVLDAFQILLPDGRELRVNQSRRRNGRGPVTVSASVHHHSKSHSVADVQWRETRASDAPFPSQIAIEVPSLSVSLMMDVPSSLGDVEHENSQAYYLSQLAGQATGQQHGVLVSLVEHNAVDKEISTPTPLLPALLTLHPRSPGEL